MSTAIFWLVAAGDSNKTGRSEQQDINRDNGKTIYSPFLD